MEDNTQCSCCMMVVCTHVALTAVDSWATTNQGLPQVSFQHEWQICCSLVKLQIRRLLQHPATLLSVCRKLQSFGENVGEHDMMCLQRLFILVVLESVA